MAILELGSIPSLPAFSVGSMYSTWELKSFDMYYDDSTEKPPFRVVGHRFDEYDPVRDAQFLLYFPDFTACVLFLESSTLI